jgi:hypothetical protein
MGSDISLESAPGRGSIFTCTLSLPPAAAAGPERAEVPCLDGKAVLIASPAAIEAGLIGRRLQAWGARTTLANTVEAAADVSGLAWDVLIVDGGWAGPRLSASAVGLDRARNASS